MELECLLSTYHTFPCSKWTLTNYHPSFKLSNSISSSYQCEENLYPSQNLLQLINQCGIAFGGNEIFWRGEIENLEEEMGVYDTLSEFTEHSDSENL